MRVYMDAVLFPSIHEKPEIFGQEGWHFELSPQGEAGYKGVVFNEMKGAFASPDSPLEYEMSRRLFPDTCYQYEYGGHPAHIPELSYQQFAAAHKRLYHPSNSYIFLDGKIELETVLGVLDREYLSRFNTAPAPGPIPFQQPVNPGTSEIFYELSSQEDLAGRARLAQGFVACTFQDREELAALQALSDALCGDNQAPLKRRLLESGLARDLRMDLHDSVLQPWVVLEARDVKEEDFEQVAGALEDELQRLVREGLDHRRLLATLDNLEFGARQRDYGRTPQGLVFGMQVLDSWLYGGDPAANLSVGDLYENLREKCRTGWFEDLLRRTFLENPHRCQVLMRPSHTLGQEQKEQEACRLREAQAAWSQEDAREIRENQARIESWQNTPDSPEALASIPMLRLDQIPAQPETLPVEVSQEGELTVLRHTLPTGGITYLHLYFALDDLSASQLTQAAFLTHLLGSLETERYQLDQLQRELRSLLGQLSFQIESYGVKDDPARCRTFLCVSASALDGKLEKAMDLVAEILAGTHWNDPKRVYELVCQHRAALAEQAVMAGHMAVLSRVGACCSADGAAREQAGGITFLRWLKELESGFQERFPELAGELEGLAKTIFSMARLTLSVTGTHQEAAAVARRLLSQRLPLGSFCLPEAPSIAPWGVRREGIVIPADVSFAALAGPFPQAHTGQAQVMGRVASLSYLWNAVRVQGGAYGVGMLLLAGGLSAGLAGFYSFRDPSAARTLDCYAATADFLKSAGDMDLTGMIIGAVAESDPLLTPRAKGKTSDARYWRQTSYEDLCQERREILAARPEDLARLAPQVEKLAAEGAVCVLGSRRQLEACESLEEITEL